MQRCSESAGVYKLGLTVMHAEEDVHVQVLGHRDIFIEIDGERRLLEAAPVAKTEEVQELELCVHELQWLNGLPGREYRPEYQFTVEKVGS